MGKSRRQAVTLLAMLLAFCGCAFALGPSLDISQYAHTSWKIRDGSLKSPISAMAQTSDGYLWLGTDSGLVRFDGVRFINWQPPTGQALPVGRIRGLLATRDGTLWVGTDEGLASWKDGRIKQYPELAGDLVVGLFEDRTGTVWAGGVATPSGKLCEIRGENARCYGDDGSLGTGIAHLLQDGAGNLWALGNRELWRWSPGLPKMYALPDSSQGLAEDAKGQLLISTISSEIKVVAGDKMDSYVFPGPAQGVKFGPLFRDRNGAMWIGTVDRGLLHVHNGRADNFAQTDGLTSNWIRAVFEDREGNIWIATSDGLDRFRELSFPTISPKQGLTPGSVSSVLAAKEGSIWMATYGGLNRWKDSKNTIFVHQRIPDAPEHQVIDAGLPDNYIESLWEDDQQRIWVSTRRGVAVFEHGHFRSIAALASEPWVYSMAGQDGAGAWVSTDQSLLHLRDQRIAERIPWQTFGKTHAGISLLSDSSGGLYLGFKKGGLVYVKDGRVRASYADKDGLGKGHVVDLYMDRGGAVWAATQGGLSRVDNGHVATLSSENGLPCDSALWMREDDIGAAWLYMGCGLVRITHSELQGWVSEPNKVVSYSFFDASDGIRTLATSTAASPNVTISNDGRLWFTTGDGVSIIDPHNLHENKLPPPVHIEKITADDTNIEVSNGIHLPTGVRHLDIDYTALSLVVPEKVRFRVKLEGEDKDWRELVNVRHVEYTNLPPKHYRFRVLACNNSGMWNEEGATLDFVIPPAWYQTNWFRAACVALFFAMLWGIYELRVRQLAHQFNMRLEERVAERTRIARDLHDTLLQSFQALLPLLQAGINMFGSRPADALRTFEKAADHASQAIAEGRDAIQGMRMSTVEKNDLAVAIRTLGEELAPAAKPSSPNFTVVVEGVSRNLHPILRDEVYRLTTEALRNAFRHAAAQNVEVEIRYDEKYFRLRIRDDGKGIPSDVLSGDGREGHYGLPGMRERAKLVGGKLTIWTEVDGGTEIELNIPGARAFVKSARPFWYFGKRSATETDEKEPIERE